MLWGCFSSRGVGTLHKIDGIMNAVMYRDILESNLDESVQKLGLGTDYIFQQAQ